MTGSAAGSGDAVDMIGGIEVREWQGTTFDPSALRFFSVLPPEDASEGYCVRHEREMQTIDPVVHYDGALYTTGEGWHVYSCPHCRREVGPRAPHVYRQYLIWTFFQWDDPDADMLDGAFRYIGEGGPEDLPNDGKPVSPGGNE